MTARAPTAVASMRGVAAAATVYAALLGSADATKEKCDTLCLGKKTDEGAGAASESGPPYAWCRSSGEKGQYCRVSDTPCANEVPVDCEGEAPQHCCPVTCERNVDCKSKVPTRVSHGFRTDLFCIGGACKVPFCDTESGYEDPECFGEDATECLGSVAAAGRCGKGQGLCCASAESVRRVEADGPAPDDAPVPKPAQTSEAPATDGPVDAETDTGDHPIAPPEGAGEDAGDTQTQGWKMSAFWVLIAVVVFLLGYYSGVARQARRPTVSGRSVQDNVFSMDYGIQMRQFN